jgi:hypothetical protein
MTLFLKVDVTEGLRGALDYCADDNAFDVIVSVLNHLEKFFGLGVQHGGQCAETVASIDDDYPLTLARIKRLPAPRIKRIPGPNDHAIVLDDFLAFESRPKDQSVPLFIGACKGQSRESPRSLRC